MSLSFIHSFQDILYKHLTTNEIIKSLTSAVYLSIKQDAKQPFILINIARIINISNLTAKYYEMDFQISIFDHQKNQTSLTRIADEISNVLTSANLNNNSYSVISSNLAMSEIVKGQDLITTKLIMHYKALIKIY